MALSSTEYTKKVLTPEGMKNAKVFSKIAVVLIDLLGDNLNSQEKAAKKVALAIDLSGEEFYKSGKQSPFDQVRFQVNFLEGLGKAVSSVELLGKDVIASAVSLLTKSKEEIERAIVESENNRKHFEETEKIPALRIIYESTIDADVRNELLKSLKIIVSEVVLNLEETELTLTDPLILLAKVSEEAKITVRKELQPQEPAIAVTSPDTEIDSVAVTFDKFYGTSKRKLPEEELKSGRYPLDMASYKLLRMIVTSPNHRISKEEIRSEFKTYYTDLFRRLNSALSATELVLEEDKTTWIAKLRGNTDQTTTENKTFTKPIKKVTIAEPTARRKRPTALTSEFIQTGINDQPKLISEIVEILMENKEVSTRYEKYSVNVAVYEELNKLIKEGKIERTGKGGRNDPYKYRIIETETDEVETIEIPSDDITEIEEYVEPAEQITEVTPTTVSDLPNLTEGVVPTIEEAFDKISYIPPTVEELANVQFTGVYGGRFVRKFKDQESAINFIKTNMHRAGYEKYAAFFNRHFGESVLAGDPTTKPIIELAPAVLSLKVDRIYSSGEAIAELEIPVRNKPVTLKTQSGYNFNQRVPVEIYPSEKYPNVYVGIALNLKGSFVLEKITWKTTEFTVIKKAIAKLIRDLSKVAFGKDMNVDHVKHPRHPGMMVYKIQMPNAPRIYFTLGNSTKNGNDRLPPTRHLIIWAVTDHDNENQILEEIASQHPNTIKKSTR